MNATGMHISFAAALFQLSFAALAPAGTGCGGFTYVSPLPDSKLIPAESCVAFRTERVFAEPPPAVEVTVRATGEKSGPHTGRLLLSDDQRTFIFSPATPFSGDENVLVCIAAARAPGCPSGQDTLRFTFTIRPDDPSRYARIPLPEEGISPPPHPTGVTTRSGSFVPDSLPADFPRITVNVNNGAPPLSVFLSNFPFDPSVHNSPYLMTIGRDGSPVFLRRMPDNCFDFKREPNGLLTYHDQEFGYFLALDSTLAVVDSFMCGNGYPTDVHELRLLPDGHALLLGYDPERVRMDTIVQGGDSAALVYGLILQELDRSRNVVFQWRSWDHFRITDAIGVDLTGATVDYAHGNAIEVDTDGNLILSSRHLSEVTKINRLSGEIMWRWGGKNNQFTFIGDSIGFSYQHTIRRLPGGRWTMFDNGYFHAPPFSRAVEYALDEERKTATLIWQFRHVPDLFGSAMGSVQRMEDGNTLIGWGSTNPSVSLVDPSGSTLLELSLPPGVFSYRAFGSISDPLTAAGPAPRPIPRSVWLAKNYPNPFNPSTVITYAIASAGHVRLTIHDILGRVTAVLVDGPRPAGTHSVTWVATDLASGPYICRLQADGLVRTERLLLLK